MSEINALVHNVVRACVSRYKKAGDCTRIRPSAAVEVSCNTIVTSVVNVVQLGEDAPVPLSVV